nr:PREDICTED: serine/threonine-protein kinase Sgk2 [Lepisosteus oculatus]
MELNACFPCKLKAPETFQEFLSKRRGTFQEFIQKTKETLCKYSEAVSLLEMDRTKHTANNNHLRVSSSTDVNLGPSANPQARPTDFDFLTVIGKGTFGKVLLAKRKSDHKFYAVKVLQKKVILKKKEQKNIMAERNVLLKSLKHPFLVGLHYSFQTAEKLYFVLDYVNGGEVLYGFREQTSAAGSAVGYFHSLTIIFRDLKPENILLDSQGHVVLTDFGLCKEGIEPEGTTSTFCGTPEYLAPEVLRKQPYDRTVDWWCLGAVLYEMLYGLPPFYSRDVSEMYDHILHKPLHLPPGKSMAACDLLRGLLQKNPQHRMGAKADFLELKTHVFFSPINWDDLYHKRITPPYNPKVNGPADLRHIDPEFTKEMVPNSVGRTPELSSCLGTSSSNAFKGFSYVQGDEAFLN